MPLNVTPLDRLGSAIAAQETIEQIEAEGCTPDLAKLVALSRKKGHFGVVLIDHGGGATPFVGAFLGRDGSPVESTWATHATPEAALAALAR